MWGTRCIRHAPTGRSRFIPTHVGNTSCHSSVGGDQPVHPHACGEHLPPSSPRSPAAGSSPRMWGTRTSAATGGRRRRFIPTHVGNTRSRPVIRITAAVHPHACGEHRRVDFANRLIYGSSPRMWGTHKVPEQVMAALRFIPTHVGNTHAALQGRREDAVHPHACGEHTYRTTLFLKKKKHLEKSTASSSIPWSDPEAGMPPIAARRTTLDVDG
ncbi:Domain of uncharacterised function (DUF2825) [Pseudomonas aeruginosa]|nr:Domain of uncharacterised function (DUF2825) [Pseudomonas aeruginosa]